MSSASLIVRIAAAANRSFKLPELISCRLQSAPIEADAKLKEQNAGTSLPA